MPKTLTQSPIETVLTVAALKAMPITGQRSRVYAAGYYAAGDGGGGLFYWDSSDTTSADNGGTVLASTVGAAGRWKPVEVPRLDVRKFGCKGDDATDNTTALRAVFAAAKAASKAVYVPTGTYRYSDNLTVDWPITLIGEDANGSVLKQTGTAKNGLTFGAAALVANPKISTIKLLGPGSGTGKGIDASDGQVKNGLYLEDVWIDSFGLYGLHTAFCDYPTLVRTRIRNNGTHGWVADSATNAAVGIGCAFVNNGVGNAGAGIRAIDLDGFTLFGSEFGSEPYGIYVEHGGSQNWAIEGCRWESLTTAFVQIGDGSTAFPGRIRFGNCYFLGDNALTPMVALNGATSIEFHGCGGGQLPSGGVFVKAQASASQVKCRLVSCDVNSGAHVFQDNASTNYDDKLIVFGGDHTTVVPDPFAVTAGPLSFSATATRTLPIVPRQCTVTAVYATADQAIAADASNFWAVTLERYSGGASQGNIASKSFTGGILARRANTVTLGAQTTLLAGEQLVLTCTKTGTPADLVDFNVSLVYQPV